MGRPIDYRSSLPFSAEQVFGAMADPDYLRARLAEMGGNRAELLEHVPEGKGVRYRLRHGLDADNLPSAVRSLVGGDLVIERAEALRPQDTGGYRGDVRVTVAGTPASATGSMQLRDTAGGCEFAVRAEVVVKVPLIGGKVEKVIAEQVGQLLAAETDFTRRWLAARAA